MHDISSDLRFVIWIIVGIAGVFTLVLLAYLEPNLAYVVRKIFSRSSPGRPPRRSHPIAWLIFIICVLTTIFGTAIASTTPDNSFTVQLTPTPRLNLSQVAVASTQFIGRIGIVAGHSGNDSGTVCLDENGNVTLTEADVNLKVAATVQEQLTQEGYQADLLREYDTRLNGYEGDAVVSIHADSCQYINDFATGFKVSPATSRFINADVQELVECVIDRYQRTTGLFYHHFVTMDMSSHSFHEIDASVPVIVMETGFLNLDYELLVEKSELVAKGIIDGLVCYFSKNRVMTDFVLDLLGSRDSNQQRIFIMNVSGQTISFEGWRLEDDLGNVFEFPVSTVLQNDNKLYVYTYQPPNDLDLHWPLLNHVPWKSKTLIRLRDNNNNIRAVEIVP